MEHFKKAVLLDNDSLILQAWALAAKRAGVTLITFQTTEEFFKKISDLDREFTIFIDSKLANGERGEGVAERVYGLGFRRIFLATGMPAKSFPVLPWINAIVGKDPPWK